MYLGIEIGGTKLQLGVGLGQRAELIELQRRDVIASRGATGILEQIEEAGKDLLSRYPVSRIGIGFGGPVYGRRGVVQTSHQIAGWKNIPLVDWCASHLGKPAALGNDCDVAALAEACFGAGQNHRSLFYVTVGTGIGGGFVVDRQIHGTDQPAAAEIGHLRPGFSATDSHDTVESRAAGPALSKSVQKQLAALDPQDPAVKDLLARCQGTIANLTTKQISQAAAEGNTLAQVAYTEGARVLGWAIAQMVTLLAPEVVVVGGGVSLAGENLFFAPLRQHVGQYVFPPLQDSFKIFPAALGEEVVIHGAIALARETESKPAEKS